MAAGGPFHGNGSPPEGDHWTADQLEALAANNRLLAGEVRVPIKLGHSKDQPLLRNSGMVDKSGQPAAGWLENFRVDGGKLLADLRRVPAKLAGLVESGAFRTRSVELSRYTSPTTKQAHDVVSGLAFLGGTMPAVRTLDDVVALYESSPHVAIPGEPPEGVRVLDYTVDDDAARLEPIKESMTDVTFTPEQVASLAQALGVSEKDAKAIEPAKLLEAATAKTTADAAALATAETARAAAAAEAETAKRELAAAQAAAGASGAAEGKELADTLRELSAAAEQGKAANEALRVMRRDVLIGKAIEERRIAPARKADFERDYDAAPEVVERIIASLEPVTDTRAYGGSGDGAPASDDEQAAEDSMYAAYCGAVGVTGTVDTTNGKAGA